MKKGYSVEEGSKNAKRKRENASNDNRGKVERSKFESKKTNEEEDAGNSTDKDVTEKPYKNHTQRRAMLTPDQCATLSINDGHIFLLWCFQLVVAWGHLLPQFTRS